MKNYHVVPKSGGWSVIKEGAEKGRFAPTQRAAEKMAKNFATNAGGGEVVIHGRDGKIRDKDTMAPARDPFPPRDKKH
jgi:hypothetical protein